MLENSVEPTGPTNTETIHLYNLNNPAPTFIIEQIFPDISRLCEFL